MLTNEIIDEHVALWEKYIGLKELNSENIKTIQDQHGEDEVEVVDPETNKQITVREKDLWQETKYLGFGDNRAGNYFRSKYPDIFERDEKIVDLGKEIAKFEVKHFGFKLNEMTPPAMISLMQALIKKELEETPFRISADDKEHIAHMIVDKVEEINKRNTEAEVRKTLEAGK